MATMEQELAKLGDLARYADAFRFSPNSTTGGGRITFAPGMGGFRWRGEDLARLQALGYERISPVLMGKTFDDKPEETAESASGTQVIEALLAHIQHLETTAQTAHDEAVEAAEQQARARGVRYTQTPAYGVARQKTGELSALHALRDFIENMRLAGLAGADMMAQSGNRNPRPDDIPEDARPRSAGAWAFLLENWDEGVFAIIANPDGSYAAHFYDEGDTFPFVDMGYNRDLGLFHRSEFPNEREDVQRCHGIPRA